MKPVEGRPWVEDAQAEPEQQDKEKENEDTERLQNAAEVDTVEIKGDTPEPDSNESTTPSNSDSNKETPPSPAA